MNAQWIDSRYKIGKEEFEQRYYDRNESLRSIAEGLGVSPAHLGDALRQIGMKVRNPQEGSVASVKTGIRRIYTANYNLFDEWSPNMAWALGLLAADGCIQTQPPTTSLASIDIDLADKFRQATNYTGPTRWNAQNEIFEVHICNRHMVESLIKLGITPRKSHTLQMPPVPSKYLPDFTRGYCDGDGCIRVKTSKGRFDKLAVILCSGSEDIITGLHSALWNADIKCDKRFHPRPDREHDQWRIYANSYEAIQFCRFIYQDYPNCLCLSRKHQAYADYMTKHGWRYVNGPIRNRREKLPCSVEGCTQPMFARKMCKSHYHKDRERRRRQK